MQSMSVQNDYSDEILFLSPSPEPPLTHFFKTPNADKVQKQNKDIEYVYLVSS